MEENSIGDRIQEKYTRYINYETDILELTIEEAIFILEKNASVHYVEDLLQEAYKVILLDYKRVLKENEQLRTELNSLKENNEELLELANNKQWISPCYVAQNYISKQKIKDKIEEIQEEGYWLFTTDRDSDKCVEFLQELLEKE